MHVLQAIPYDQYYTWQFSSYCIKVYHFKMRLEFDRLTSFHASIITPIKCPSNRGISQKRTCTLMIKDIDISTRTTTWQGYLSTWPNLCMCFSLENKWKKIFYPKTEINFKIMFMALVTSKSNSNSNSYMTESSQAQYLHTTDTYLINVKEEL